MQYSIKLPTEKGESIVVISCKTASQIPESYERFAALQGCLLHGLWITHQTGGGRLHSHLC